MSREDSDNRIIGSILRLRKVHKEGAENASDPVTAGMQGEVLVLIGSVLVLMISLSTPVQH